MALRLAEQQQRDYQRYFQGSNPIHDSFDGNQPHQFNSAYNKGGFDQPSFQSGNPNLGYQSFYLPNIKVGGEDDKNNEKNKNGDNPFMSSGKPGQGGQQKSGKPGQMGDDPARNDGSGINHAILALKADEGGNNFTVQNTWDDGELELSASQLEEVTGGTDISAVVTKEGVVDVEKDSQGRQGVSDDKIKKMDKRQGDNSSGLDGTCGIMSSAVNGAIAMGKEGDEDKDVADAVNSGLCDPSSGGTTGDQQAEMLNKKNPDAEAKSETISGPKALAEKIKKGCLVILHVIGERLNQYSQSNRTNNATA